MQDLFRNVLCVLLVRFSSIGDILLTTPLVRALARRHPEARLVYVTKRTMAPLVADNPHLAEVVTLEPDEPIRHLARRLRTFTPTHGLDLHGSIRSAGLRLLVRCHWSGYRKRKFARARLIASGDTGVMHMATGVGTPVVALFGPTVSQFGFLPYRARSLVLERTLDCRPCSATGTASCPLGHHRCLADITPADVVAAVERLVA